jgi:hypothetical protein
VRKQEEKKTPSSANATDGYQLLDPVFEVTAVLQESHLPDFRSGQRVHVKFRSREGISLWKMGYAAIDRLIARLLKHSRYADEANPLF